MRTILHKTEDDLVTVIGARTLQVAYNGSDYSVFRPAPFPWLDAMPVGTAPTHSAAIRLAAKLAG